jgi:hypothetical protein
VTMIAGDPKGVNAASGRRVEFGIEHGNDVGARQRRPERRSWSVADGCARVRGLPWRTPPRIGKGRKGPDMSHSPSRRRTAAICAKRPLIIVMIFAVR